MKVPVRPPRRHIPANDVVYILDSLRPYGPYVHTLEEQARYFCVTKRTIVRWRTKGIDLGLWSAPDRERMRIAIAHMYMYRDTLTAVGTRTLGVIAK